MRGWPRLSIIPLLLVAAVTGWHTFQAREASLVVLLGAFITIGSSLLVGLLCLSAIPATDEGGHDLLLTFAVGALVYQSLLFALALVSPVSFAANVLSLGVLSLAGVGLLAKHGRLTAPTVSPAAFTCTAVSILAAGFWSSDNLQPLRIGDTQVVAHTWQDMFFHARQVAMFALSQGAQTLGDINMSGARVPAYHYAGYMIPAAIRSLGGGTSYSVAAALTAPVGMVLSGFAAYAFGKLVSGKDVVGLLACGLLLLLPDASYQGFGNRWSGYAFFQQVGVTGPAAVAAMGIGWALVLQGVARGSWRTVLPGLALCGSTALFKVQIFLAYGVAPLLFALLFHPKLSRPARVLWLALAGAAYFGALAVMPSLPATPTFALSKAGFAANLGNLLGNFAPDAPMLRFLQATLSDTGKRRVVVGGLALLLSTHGLAILALAPAWWLARRRRVLTGPMLWFPWFIVIPHLLVGMVLAPNTGWGDPFEVIHKTFVWPVWAVTVWVGATLAVLWWRDGAGPRFAVLSAVLIAGTVPLFWLGGSVLSGIPWAHFGMNLSMPRSLYDAALFVREHSKPGELVQVSENDPYLMVPAFSERAFWMVRSKVNSGEPGAEAARRFEELKRLSALPTFDALATETRGLGVSWWIQRGPCPEDWTSHAAFSADDVRVFALQR